MDPKPCAPISFKVSVVDLSGTQQEKRRFSIDRELATEFKNLETKLLTYFPSLKAGQKIKVVYKDSDGDDIIVSTDDDLKCAIDESEGVFKFQAILLPAPSVTKAKPTEPPKSTAVHKDIKCNECSKDIKGHRYKCIDCPDFDLCQQCESKSSHKHNLLKLVQPLKSPELTLHALCMVVKVFLDDQSCSHKDCSKCKLLRSCANSWKDGTISKQWLKFVQILESNLGNVCKCKTDRSNSISPMKGEPKVNGTAPEPAKAKTPQKPAPVLNGPFKPILNGDVSKVGRPLLVSTSAFVPVPQKVLRCVTPGPGYSPIITPMRPPVMVGNPGMPGMHSFVFTQGPPLQYNNNPQFPMGPSFTFDPRMPIYPPQPSPYHGHSMPFLPGGPVAFNGFNNVAPIQHHQPQTPVPMPVPPEANYQNEKIVPNGNGITNGNSVSASTTPPSGNSSQTSSQPDDEQVILQRNILELSSRGYSGKVSELEDVLRSVDLDVEKASIILDLSKDL